MIIVDWSHSAHRMLYVAISQAKPGKIDGKYITEDYIQFFFHLMLNSLRLIGHKFNNAGEIILAIDDKNYWRKNIYPEYKGQRKASRAKSDINFPEFYEQLATFTDEMEKHFPYTVLNVKDCEADDIIGVLSKFYGKTERVIAISSDKDMRQIISYGAELYDPIKTEFVRMSLEEVKDYKLHHTLAGDGGDNIPNVWQKTKFTDNFLRYLKLSGIYLETPYEFDKLTVSEKLYDEYDVYKTNRKGEIQPEKDIFKMVPFGDVKINKAKQDLNEFFTLHPLLKKHYEENAKLVLFDNIPQEIQNDIIKTYNDLEYQYNPNEIFNFLIKNNLRKLMNDITDFYQDNSKKEDVMAEWV